MLGYINIIMFQILRLHCLNLVKFNNIVTSVICIPAIYFNFNSKIPNWKNHEFKFVKNYLENDFCIFKYKNRWTLSDPFISRSSGDRQL